MFTRALQYTSLREKGCWKEKKSTVTAIWNHAEILMTFLRELKKAKTYVLVVSLYLFYYPPNTVVFGITCNKKKNYVKYLDCIYKPDSNTKIKRFGGVRQKGLRFWAHKRGDRNICEDDGLIFFSSSFAYIWIILFV